LVVWRRTHADEKKIRSTAFQIKRCKRFEIADQVFDLKSSMAVIMVCPSAFPSYMSLAPLDLKYGRAKPRKLKARLNEFSRRSDEISLLAMGQPCHQTIIYILLPPAQ
jgi:hypothetical protein